MAGSKSKHRRRKKTNSRWKTVKRWSYSHNSLRFPRLSTVEYAEFGLECYKKKRGPEHTDYKVVRALGSCRVLAIIPDTEEILDWCHVSFIARSRKHGRDDSKDVLFFVEFVDFGHGDGLVLNNYSILKLDFPEITYGCGFCPPDDDHPHPPRDAFFAGESDYMPIDDTSQKEMAICFEKQMISNRKDNRFVHYNLECGLSFKPEPFDDVVLDPSLRYSELSAFEYAELALGCYKKEHKIMYPDYEVVRTLGSCRVLSPIPTVECYGVIDWCHISFIAIPRNSNCDDDEVLFFAELVDCGYGDRLHLNCYSISKLDAPGITYGCGFCPLDDDHPHPRSACCGGQWDYKPTDDTYQQEMAACFQLQVISNRKENRNPSVPISLLSPDPVKPDPSCFSPMLSDYEYAKLALSYISKIEEVEYELVQTLYSHRQQCRLALNGYSEWCHVGFSGKLKNGDDTLVHFFAELNDPGVRSFSLSAYSRMDLSSIGMECGICPVSEKYPHPPTVSCVVGTWSHYGCLQEDYIHCAICSNRDKDMSDSGYSSNDED